MLNAILSSAGFFWGGDDTEELQEDPLEVDGGLE